ncbi:MAG TPA: hypothetical protein VMU82_16250 [Acetobacteraceae bacterium]|nr:hypothetical protein [Acetobacteraceae bacterium]
MTIASATADPRSAQQVHRHHHAGGTKGANDAGSISTPFGLASATAGAGTTAAPNGTGGVLSSQIEALLVQLQATQGGNPATATATATAASADPSAATRQPAQAML